MKTLTKRVQRVEWNLRRRGLLQIAKEIANSWHVSLGEVLGRGQAIPIVRARRDLYGRLFNEFGSVKFVADLLEVDWSSVRYGLRALGSHPESWSETNGPIIGKRGSCGSSVDSSCSSSSGSSFTCRGCATR